MAARTKLNAIVVGAVLLCAALLGGAAHSWLIFIAVAVIGTVLMVHAGEVRLKTSDRDIVSQDRSRKWRGR